MISPASDPKRHPNQVIILITSVIIGFSCFLPIDLYLPSLPHIVTALNATTDQIQHSVTFFLLGLGATQLIFGPLSDRFGRKPILLFGLCITTAGSIIIVFCHSPDMFLAGRFIQGVGAGAGMLLARTIIIDIISGEQLAIVGSCLAVTFGFVPILAPALGGLLQTYWGWRSNFIFLALFQLIVLIFVIFVCPETNQNKNTESTKPSLVMANYGTLLSSRVFIGFMLGAGSVMALNATYAVIAPFLFQDHFQLSPKTFGFISIVLGVGSLSSKLINTWVVRKIKIRGSIILSYMLISAAGLFLLGLHVLTTSSVVSVILGIFIATLSFGFMTSNALAGALTPFRYMGGTATALYGSMQVIVGFLCSSIVAALPWHSDLTLALTYLCVGILGLLVFITLVPRSN